LNWTNVGYLSFQVDVDQEQLNRRIMPDTSFATEITLPVGKHRAEIDLDQVLSTQMGQEELGRRGVTHSASIEVVENTVPLVAQLTSPPANEMRGIIRVPWIDVHSWPQTHGGVSVMPMVSSAREAGKDRPTCFFDMFVVPDPTNNPQTEFPVGLFRDSSFATIDMQATGQQALLDQLKGKSAVRIILRSNAERAATQSLHKAIWKGELIYDDVPVSIYINGKRQGD
jgi:hypothetical protein